MNPPPNFRSRREDGLRAPAHYALIAIGHKLQAGR
jgi:hypothetical protein